MEELHIDEITITGNKVAKGYHHNLYREEFIARPKLDNLPFEVLDSHSKEILEALFTEGEIENCLRECNADKSQGLDGFNFKFFHTFWPLLKEDILDLFNDFHKSKCFVKSLNSTSLVLIPKMVGAKNIKNFRPISLVSSLYKLIFKVLTNRLAKVLHLIIEDCQHTFVKGRQITDALTIVNEVVDDLIANKKDGVLCKLDMEKILDHVNWNLFLTTYFSSMALGQSGGNKLKHA